MCIRDSTRRCERSRHVISSSRLCGGAKYFHQSWFHLWRRKNTRWSLFSTSSSHSPASRPNAFSSVRTAVVRAGSRRSEVGTLGLGSTAISAALCNFQTACSVNCPDEFAANFRNPCVCARVNTPAAHHVRRNGLTDCGQLKDQPIAVNDYSTTRAYSGGDQRRAAFC